MQHHHEGKRPIKDHSELRIVSVHYLEGKSHSEHQHHETRLVRSIRKGMGLVRSTRKGTKLENQQNRANEYQREAGKFGVYYQEGHRGNVHHQKCN